MGSRTASSRFWLDSKDCRSPDPHYDRGGTGYPFLGVSDLFVPGQVFLNIKEIPQVEELKKSELGIGEIIYYGKATRPCSQLKASTRGMNASCTGEAACRLVLNISIHIQNGAYTYGLTTGKSARTFLSWCYALSSE